MTHERDIPCARRHRPALHEDHVKLLPHALLDELAAKAAASPRGRAHHNIHPAPEDPVQRFVVVALANSYFRPHRHPLRGELAVLLRGQVDVLVFDAERTCAVASCRWRRGRRASRTRPSREPGTRSLPGSDGCAFLEVKQGPYDPTTASEFAPWAPAEGTPQVPQFLQWLRVAQAGDQAPA